MTEEFYHKNIFGEVIDVDLQEKEEDEKPLLDKRGREFNIFSLTDAFGSRKKKDAWVIYQKALIAGLSPEEIFYKIVWQVKSMLIASKTKSVQETDMKPYSYTKSKSFLKNFAPGELEKLSEKLVVGYIEARRGKGQIETLLEKIILTL